MQSAVAATTLASGERAAIANAYDDIVVPSLGGGPSGGSENYNADASELSRYSPSG